uniref:Uncharacterized protein n=1 Tax=Latimeria chalumnae TaxID=7897 RepID=H3A4B2_LATCH
ALTSVIMSNNNDPKKTALIYKLVTWNVNSVNNPTKRYKILSHLSKMQCDVSFLQETHLIPSEVLKLRTRWVGQVYSSSFSSKRNGVCILISKKTPFVELETESDEEGRFVIVRGLLKGMEVVLISIYAPMQNPISFYVKLGTILSKYKGKNIIAGRDWNRVLDSSLDKSSAPTPSDLNITRGLRELCREIGLIDSWRAVHGTKRDYTFFSRVHSSYSRLDTFLTSHAPPVNIHNRTLSDHVLVSMEFILEPRIFRHIWRVNNSLLKDKAFVATLKTEIASFFQLNEDLIDSVQLLWDAFKATLQGWLISRFYCIYRKKQYQKQWKELEQIVNDLEQLHKASPKDVMIPGELKKAHLDLQEFIHKKTEYALYQTKNKYFETGDETIKVLENVNMVSKIRDNNEIIKNSTEITQEFQSFYKELYTSQGNITPESTDNFLNQSSLPVLTEEGRSLLENRISEQEVKKAPGCDGYTVDFYKVAIDQLAPKLAVLFQNIIDSGHLSPSTQNPYLIRVLQSCEFPSFTVKAVEALYRCPSTQVCVNGLLSTSFGLGSGTRQGVSTPYCFALAIEPLALQLRQSLEVKGMKIGDLESKMCLYADDILLLLTDLKTSIPAILNIIDKVHEVSEFKINWQESEIMPLNKKNIHCSSHELKQFPFTIKKDDIKYLGINLTSRVEDLFNANGPQILKEIKGDLERWQHLPLSLWGRVATLKMIALCDYFHPIRSIFLKFLWEDKKPRIAWIKLLRKRGQGGLGVPNLYYYYLAANIIYPLTWAFGERMDLKIWCQLEE